jgi:hypothetical protein
VVLDFFSFGSLPDEFVCCAAAPESNKHIKANVTIRARMYETPDFELSLI